MRHDSQLNLTVVFLTNRLGGFLQLGSAPCRPRLLHLDLGVLFLRTDLWSVVSFSLCSWAAYRKLILLLYTWLKHLKYEETPRLDQAGPDWTRLNHTSSSLRTPGSTTSEYCKPTALPNKHQTSAHTTRVCSFLARWWFSLMCCYIDDVCHTEICSSWRFKCSSRQLVSPEQSTNNQRTSVSVGLERPGETTSVQFYASKNVFENTTVGFWSSEWFLPHLCYDSGTRCAPGPQSSDQTWSSSIQFSGSTDLKHNAGLWITASCFGLHCYSTVGSVFPTFFSRILLVK